MTTVPFKPSKNCKSCKIGMRRESGAEYFVKGYCFFMNSFNFETSM